MRTTMLCAAVAAAFLSGCSVVGGATVAPTNGMPVNSAIVDLSDNQAAEVFLCKGGDFVYVPVPAVPAGGFTKVKVLLGVATATLTEWPDESEKTNKLLSELSLDISKLNASASMGLASLVNADANNSVYLLDFMKYRMEPLTTTDGTFLGWGKVGVGLRIVIKLYSGEASVGGSFASLAASVKGGVAKGTMSVNLVGINSSEVTAAMPFSFGELTDASVERVLEGMTVLKTKLYDKDTSIYPRTLAKLLCKVPTVKVAQQKPPAAPTPAPGTVDAPTPNIK